MPALVLHAAGGQQALEDHHRQRRAFTHLRYVTQLIKAQRSWHVRRLRNALHRLQGLVSGDLHPVKPLAHAVQIHTAFKWIALCGPSPPPYTWCMGGGMEPLGDDLAGMIQKLAQSSALLSGRAKSEVVTLNRR